MKTCKRFLAMMLTLAMVLSLCAFTVSADRVTHTPIPADGEKLITLWDAEYWSSPEDMSVTKGSTAVWFNHYSPASVIKTSFGVVGATTAGSTVAVVEDPLDANNKVLKVNSNLIQDNYRSWFNDEKTHAMDDNNVLSFSTRMMVPSKQAEGVDKTAVTRTWTLPFQIKSFDGKTAYTNSTVKISPAASISVSYNAANQLEVSTTINNIDSKKLYLNPVVVAEDEYFTVDFEFYLVDGQKPYYCVYVNDKLMCTAIATFHYNKVVTADDGTVTKYALGMDLLKYSQSNLNATTYLDETKISAHKINTMPVFTVGKTSSEEPIEAAAKTNPTVLSNVGFFGKSLQQSTGTTVATVYSHDTTTVPGETLININTTAKGLTRLIANVRSPIDSIPYISIDATDPLYIVNNLDIYIPAGTEANTRSFYFSNTSIVRAEGESDNDAFDSSSVIYNAVIKNGKLNFTQGIASDVVKKKFTEKSEEVTFPSDTLVNVKFIMEITGAEATGYDVKVYCLVDDNLANVAEYVYPVGEFGFSQFGLDITNSTKSPIDTKIDNVDISLHSDYTIPEKTWNLVDFAYPSEVSVNGNAVNVEGLILGSTLEAMDVVVAFYNANGKLIAPLAKTSLTNVAGNDLAINVNAEIPEGAATAKVFYWNNLVSAKPLMTSDKITIE